MLRRLIGIWSAPAAPRSMETSMTRTRIGKETGLFAQFSRRVVGVAAAVAVAAGIALGSAGTATAATPGAFNRAQCKPGTNEIVQEIEAYRSYANEIVWVQGGLNNRTTGATAVSAWMPGEGGTANNAVTWSSVTSGDYAVSYRWAVWDATTVTWVTSDWILLAPVELNTFGTAETYPGTGIYISPPDAAGRCSM
jgi:hypothetical protein